MDIKTITVHTIIHNENDILKINKIIKKNNKNIKKNKENKEKEYNFIYF